MNCRSGKTRRMDFNTRLKHKALMYVFGKERKRIVSVDIGSEAYYVRCEFEGKPGSYYVVEYPFSGLNGLDKEINKALKVLNWIAEGNEFPEPEPE